MITQTWAVWIQAARHCHSLVYNTLEAIVLRLLPITLGTRLHNFSTIYVQECLYAKNLNLLSVKSVDYPRSVLVLLVKWCSCSSAGPPMLKSTSLTKWYTCRFVLKNSQSWIYTAMGKTLLTARHSWNAFSEPCPTMVLKFVQVSFMHVIRKNSNKPLLASNSYNVAFNECLGVSNIFLSSTWVQILQFMVLLLPKSRATVY